MDIKTTLISAILSCSVIYGYTQTISGGNGFSIMLCNDSLLWTVGSNSIGQLGNGSTTDELIPIKVDGLTDIISVQAGASHSLALKSDGTVWSWGNNASGQLGNNSTTPSSIPVQIPGLSNVVKIIAGGFHNVAITSDSIALMWGSNQNDQINSTGTDKLFPIPGGGNVIDVAAGDGYTVIYHTDTIIQIQSNIINYIFLSDVISLSSGTQHFFMVKSDSTIWAWGDNQYGQLGDGTTVSQGGSSVVQITGLSNIISIKGGQRHSMALKSDGTVWTWGWNGLGQLGDGTLVDQLTPTQVPGLDSVIEIATGSHHCMARRSDSSIWVWGNNGLGQLGNDTAINTTIPVQMMLSCQYQCPAPQVYQGGDLTICFGDSVTIFGIYQQVAGMYYDSLLTPNGCDSIIQIELTVDPLPTVTFTGLDTAYCLDSSVAIDTLTGTPSGGIFSGTGVVSGVFDPFSTGFGTFDITYSYTDLNGCVSVETQSVTISNCTSIEYLEYEDFKIFPNPSTGIVNIDTDKRVQINNTLGQTVYEGISNQIDLSRYGRGVYFVRVGTTVKKLIITNSNIR